MTKLVYIRNGKRYHFVDSDVAPIPWSVFMESIQNALKKLTKDGPIDFKSK